jgi:Protein of unknown function (DUF3168)
MIPDGEAVVGAYLRSHSAIKALGARVVGKTPGDTTKPWVRVTQLDDPAVGDSRSEHLIEWFGQLDCYAGKDGGQQGASLLRRTVREALSVAYKADLEGAVVTGVRFTSCPRIPDTDFEPARERYALSIVAWMH